MKLSVDRLSKQYKNKIAVDRVSFTLSEGVTGLLGANGTGKTTLMRMMTGILAPTSGEISADGIAVQTEEYRSLLGYLPQDFGYYPEFTAREFILYIAALKGLEKKYVKRKTDELLEVVGLSDAANKKIKTFSGGMKQRVGIAQAIVNDPKVLILDEPTAGLDPKERVRFRNLIAKTVVIGSCIFSAALLAGLIAILYGMDGLDAIVQMELPLSAYSFTMGQFIIVQMIVMVTAAILFATFSMAVSEVVKNSLAVMGIMVGLYIFSQLELIPPQYHVLEQIKDVLPSNQINVWTLMAYRLVGFGGHYVTTYVAAPVMYVLISVLMIFIGKIAYDRFQVTGR